MKKILQKLGMGCLALMLMLLMIMVKDNEPVYAAENCVTALVSSMRLDGDYGYQDMAVRSNGAARQAFYNMLEAAAEEFVVSKKDLTSNVICELDVTDLGLSIDELAETYFVMSYDNPQYYWMSNTFSFNETKSGLTVLFSTFEEYRTYNSRSHYDALVVEKIQEYDIAVAELASCYDITLAIHDKLIHDIEYAYKSDGITPSDSVFAHSIIGVVDNSISEAVCEGYAKMYQLLLNRYGISNVLVCGKGNGDNHAWNLVQMDDGNYYYTDVTWDDTNFLVNNAGEDECSYQYFNMPSTDFNVLHTANTPESSGIDFLYALPNVSESYAYTFYASKSGLVDERDIYSYADASQKDGTLATSIANAIKAAYKNGENKIYLYSYGSNYADMSNYGYAVSNAIEIAASSAEETAFCGYTTYTLADECVVEFQEPANRIKAVTLYKDNTLIGEYVTIDGAFSQMTDPSGNYTLSFNPQIQNEFYLSPSYNQIPDVASIIFSGGKEELGTTFYTTAIEICNDLTFSGNATFDLIQLVGRKGNLYLEDAEVSLKNFSRLGPDIYAKNCEIVVLQEGSGQCELSGDVHGECDVTVIDNRLTLEGTVELDTLTIKGNGMVDFMGFWSAEDYNYHQINKIISDIASPLMTSENNHDFKIGEVEIAGNDTWYITHTTLRQNDMLPRVSVGKLSGADKVSINYLLTASFSTTGPNGEETGNTTLTIDKSVLLNNEGICFSCPSLGLDQITAYYNSEIESGELDLIKNGDNFHIVLADSYIGNINSELISFDLKQTESGAYYLTGQIVVVEWVYGTSTVPKDTPVMTFKSTDGTEEISVFVTPTGTNTYYFDRFIEGLSMDKEYVFEITSGTEANHSPNRSMNVSLATSPQIPSIKNLGKIGEQKISYYQADNGELRLYRRNTTYVGNINSELIKTELVKGPNGNYVSGQIVVVEWENGVSTVPFETPIMYFKSTDGLESLPVFVTPTGTNTYYFDRSLGDMDTSKEYVFTIASGDELNVSQYRSMTVTTAAMENKEGLLWQSDTQYVRYRTDANTGELRIYAVNK